MPTIVTKTVKSAGGDYSTLAAYEAGEQGDLPTLDRIARAECYAFLDAGGDPLFDGWTTDATRYIDIVVAAGQQHNGTRGTGYRRLIVGFGHGVDIREDFLRATGIAIESAQEGGVGQWGDRGYHIDMGGAGDIRISKSYESVGLTNDQSLIRVFNASGTIKVWNCMSAPDLGAGGSRINHIDITTTGTMYIYNNTISGSSLGAFEGCIVRAGSTPTVVCKNNVCDRGATPDVNSGAYRLSGATTTGSTNNLSDDGTSPGSNPITGFPVYVDEANGDLHIAGSDAVCRDVGADLSADANIAFADDIDGDARPQGSAWDVGADEFLASSLTDAPIMSLVPEFHMDA